MAIYLQHHRIFGGKYLPKYQRGGGKDRDGSPVYSDPDGRQWKKRRKP